MRSDSRAAAARLLCLLALFRAAAAATWVVGTWVSYDGYPLAGATIDITGENGIVAGATLTGTYHPVTGEGTNQYVDLTLATRSVILASQCTFTATATVGSSPVRLVFSGTAACDAAGKCAMEQLSVQQTVGIAVPTTFLNPFKKAD